MDKETIVRNFSRYAHTYDRYANVQKAAALVLLNQIKKDGFKNILELGCGTGNYTVLLREKFKTARLKAIDISGEMIEVAREKLRQRQIEFMVADAEVVNLEENFDLITSNAALQWLEDLPAALIKYKGLLKEDGIISFSIFGALTFWQLNTALRHTFNNVDFTALNFVAKEAIEEILKKIFKQARLKEIRFQESFSCLKELLDKIKYTGIRGEGLNGKAYFTRQILKKLEFFYLDKFGQIRTTYQIFFCQGAK